VVAACQDLNDERQQRLRNGTAANLLRRRRLLLSIAEGSALDVFITMISHDRRGMAEPSCVIEIEERLDFECGEAQALLTVPGITAAERQVATALADGLSNQEIADRLGKTVYAVKFLLHQIYRKTGISNRAGLVARLRSGRQPAASAGRQRTPYRYG
jgi:DNA-binding CsgD family transcriptional regulator